MAAALRRSAVKHFAAPTPRLHSAISTTHSLQEPQNCSAHHSPADNCNAPPPPVDNRRAAPPLARLPTSSLLRGLMLHTVTRSPTLLGLGTALMLSVADKIDHIPPLKWIVDKTFYAHFCAGATPSQISATMASLRSLGYAGIILNYAREVDATAPSEEAAAAGLAEIQQWLAGSLCTIALAAPGDFVAIKLSGAGSRCLPLLAARRPCTDEPELARALDRICSAARQRGVGLLVDAEQARLQDGVDDWALHYMRLHNTGPAAVVFNTYQMYLKRAPAVLARHLALARHDASWRLGVKLVRGAYLHSDPRHLMHDTKADTDRCYDAAARMLIVEGVDTVVASHNRHSVLQALALKRQQEQQQQQQQQHKGGALLFAQLMGMADELSLELVAQGDARVLKYAAWGGTGECVKYLLRRADENKDAVGGNRDNYRAITAELRRRLLG